MRKHVTMSNKAIWTGKTIFTLLHPETWPENVLHNKRVILSAIHRNASTFWTKKDFSVVRLVHVSAASGEKLTSGCQWKLLNSACDSTCHVWHRSLHMCEGKIFSWEVNAAGLGTACPHKHRVCMCLTGLSTVQIRLLLKICGDSDNHRLLSSLNLAFSKNGHKLWLRIISSALTTTFNIMFPFLNVKSSTKASGRTHLFIFTQSSSDRPPLTYRCLCWHWFLRWQTGNVTHSREK